MSESSSVTEHTLTVFVVKRSSPDLPSWKAIGVEFPHDNCYVWWDQQTYPEDTRMDNDHMSFYGSIEDIINLHNNDIEVVHEFTFEFEQL